MTLIELRQVLQTAGIDDVLLAGFLDRAERPLQFHPLLGSVFLECEGIILRLGSVEYSGRLRITRVQQVSSDVDLDDDLEFAVSSIKELLLKEPDGASRVQKLKLWNIVEGPVGLECSAIRMDLANGQTLFFDPSYHFGIRLGGAEQQDIWTENTVEKAPPVTQLELSEPVTG